MEDDKQQHELEQDAIVMPALTFGLTAGASGYLIGSTAALFRQSRPVLFGLATGLQWFTMAAAFSASRSLLLRTSYLQRKPDESRVLASGVAAGLVGGVAGAVLRGPRRAVQGAVLFTGIGVIGQFVQEVVVDLYPNKPEDKDEKRPSILDSKWSPVPRLTDAQYIAIQQKKLDRLDAQIAAIDAKIERLEQSKQDRLLYASSNE